MKPSDMFLSIAFFGTKREADDIIEYLAIWGSLLLSLLLAAGLAIGVGKMAGVWSGLIAGLAVYCASMHLCSLVFRRVHANR
jgi:high-affinity Fe2+/Pb2+ permease